MTSFAKGYMSFSLQMHLHHWQSSVDTYSHCGHAVQCVIPCMTFVLKTPLQQEIRLDHMHFAQVKEVAVMHSEGILAGEMKHGPLALVDECMQVVVIVTRDSMYAKMHAVIQQLQARGARLVVLCNFKDPNIEALASPNCHLIQVNATPCCYMHSVTCGEVTNSMHVHATVVSELSILFIIILAFHTALTHQTP